MRTNREFNVNDCTNLLDVLLLLKNNIEKSIRVSTLAFFDIEKQKYDSSKKYGIALVKPFPLLDNNQEYSIQAYFFNENGFNKNDIVLVLFTDNNFISSLKVLKPSLTEDTNYHKTQFAIVIPFKISSDDYATKEWVKNYVVGNPAKSPTIELTSITIGDTTYSINSTSKDWVKEYINNYIIPQPDGEIEEYISKIKINNKIYGFIGSDGGNVNTVNYITSDVNKNVNTTFFNELPTGVTFQKNQTFIKKIDESALVNNFLEKSYKNIEGQNLYTNTNFEEEEKTIYANDLTFSNDSSYINTNFKEEEKTYTNNLFDSEGEKENVNI